MNMNKYKLFLLIISFFIFSMNIFAAENKKISVTWNNFKSIDASAEINSANTTPRVYDECGDPLSNKLSFNSKSSYTFDMSFSSVVDIKALDVVCKIPSAEDFYDDYIEDPYGIHSGVFADYYFGASAYIVSESDLAGASGWWNTEFDLNDKYYIENPKAACDITVLSSYVINELPEDYNFDECTVSCYNDPKCDIIKACHLEDAWDIPALLEVISTESKDYCAIYKKHFNVSNCEGTGVTVDCDGGNCFGFPNLYSGAKAFADNCPAQTGNDDAYIVRKYNDDLLSKSGDSGSDSESDVDGGTDGKNEDGIPLLNKSSDLGGDFYEFNVTVSPGTFTEGKNYECTPVATLDFGEDGEHKFATNPFVIYTDSTISTEKRVCEYDNLPCVEIKDKDVCELNRACYWDYADEKCKDAYVAADPCNDVRIRKVLKIIGFILFIAKIAVPIIIIGFGTFDLAKAVIGNDDKDLSKQVKRLVMRVVAGIIVFFIPTIVNALFKLSDKFNIINDDKYETCRNCLLDPTDDTKCDTSSD